MMFLLEIPILELDEEDEDVFHESFAWINPHQISSVVLGMSKKQCVVTMTNQEWFSVSLPVVQFEKLVNEFIEESLITKIYKNKKDKQ
jgi:hypothetical protein